MVTTSSFGGGANQIGINSSSYSACVASYATVAGCSSEPYGACTAVAGGSSYDQFSTFWGVTFGQYVPVDSTWSCAFLFNGPYQPGGSTFATQYQ